MNDNNTVITQEQRKKNNRDVMLENIRRNARCQSFAVTRENYFKSCESHGPESAEVVAQVRKELESE
jgi:hypothetical protein